MCRNVLRFHLSPTGHGYSLVLRVFAQVSGQVLSLVSVHGRDFAFDTDGAFDIYGLLHFSRV